MRTIPNKKRGAAPAPFRMTPQRAEILRTLEGNKSHPSVEELHRRIVRKFPGVSVATVYNTLESLLGRGEIAEVRIDRERSRFDPCTDGHAHLMCVKCGRIADLKAPPKPPVPAGKPAGFKILHYNLEFYGVCPACGKPAGRKEKKSCAKKKKK
ncbi:MAG: transcriptional repressor [Elusimicrobiales bacterium]|nr:transcriptional repressor [Elusimicrobiales bacterium]